MFVEGTCKLLMKLKCVRMLIALSNLNHETSKSPRALWSMKRQYLT
jgi:hypothetical protein